MRPGPEGPGKYGAATDLTCCVRRFNEAGAGRPRKVGVALGLDYPGQASMRPGPEGPGKMGLARNTSMLLTRFNEAGAGRPRKVSVVPAVGLLAGGFNEAGAGRPRKGVVKGHSSPPFSCASMRPGPEGPGKRAVGTGRHTGAEASMRPGPEGPGKRPDQDGNATPSVRFNEAGAGRPRKAIGQSVSSAWDRASMRPGPEGPGKSATRRPSMPSTTVLQ